MKQQHHRRRTRTCTLVLGVVLASALLGIAGPAQAHDELISTNPADQAQIQTMPDSIVLTFEEPAEQVGSQVIVRGPNGDVAQGKPVFAKSTVTQAVQPGAPAGRYTVLWRVTSDDGHPVSGSFTFTAAAANPASASTSSTTSPGGVTSSAADPTTAGSQSTAATSKAPRWLWLLVLLVLLVPVAIFVRRRPGGPHDASPR